MAPRPPPLLAAVAVALRVSARVATLEHVLRAVDAFLDGTVRFSLADVVARGPSRLFERVLHRVLVTHDEIVREFQLSRALQAAVKLGQLAVVQRIHDEHPQRTDANEVLTLAAHSGDLAMLQWLLAHRSEGLCIPDRSSAARGPMVHDVPKCATQKLLDVARQNKHVQMIRWLHETYFAGDTKRLGGVGDIAAAAGDLDAVRWLHGLDASDCFTHKAVDEAASAGHTEVVKFLLSKRSEGFSSKAVAGAMLGRHGAIAALLRPNGWTLEDFSSDVMTEAAKCGRLDLLQMDNPYGASLAFSTTERFDMLGELPGNSHSLQRLMQLACEAGHLDVVKWLVECRGVNCDARSIRSAVLKSREEILQWIHENECGSWEAGHMDEAAGLGDLDMLRWFHQNRREGCTKNAMDNAARGGHLHVLKWLKDYCSEGCSSEAFLAAVCNGHLEMVQWLHENQLGMGVPDAIDRAAGCGHLKVVQWLHANRPGHCTITAMDRAARNGHLDVVMWLHEHRTEGCTESAMNFAPLTVTKWLHQNRTEGCTEDALLHSARRGDSDRLTFLMERYSLEVLPMYANGAAMAGHLYIVQWLYERYPTEFDLRRLHQFAREYGHDDLAVWLGQQRKRRRE